MGRCFSFLLVIILSLVSCNKNEVIYSCNSEVNDWVNKNLYGISTMTRSEWKALDNEYKIPVFRAFSQEQRILFWKEKINDIINDYEWKEEEYNHLIELLEFINNNEDIFDFSKDFSDEQIEKIEVFSYKLVEKALNELEWNLPLIKSIIASGDDIILNDEKETNELRNPKCNCNIDAAIEWCITTHCEGGNCLEAAHGCGDFIVQSCDGTCGGI